MSQETELDLVTALGRLLSQASERARFATDREAWSARATPEARAALSDLDLGELEAQARILIEKRAGEVAERLPRTRAQLGPAYAEAFTRYAELAPWPKGHLRHLYDARAFLRWLRADQPHAPHSMDELALDLEIARREGRSRVVSGLTHHADLLVSCLYVGVQLHRGRRLRLVLPLPLPSALGRRLAWRQPEAR